MGDIFSFLVTPALVSLLVSLWAGKFLEARRARRDYITKLFEVTREDVRRAVEAAVDYFAIDPSDRTFLQEAKVILADKEIRSAMPVILGPHPELHNANRVAALQAYQNLIAELTGGNFQEQLGTVDVEHIRRLTLAGASLRSALSRMRDTELMLLSQSTILRRWDQFKVWCNS